MRSTMTVHSHNDDGAEDVQPVHFALSQGLCTLFLPLSLDGQRPCNLQVA